MSSLVPWYVCAACLTPAWLCAPPAHAAVTFSDVTATARLQYQQQATNEPPNCLLPPTPVPGIECMPERITGGAAAGDFDRDGAIDLYVTRLDDTDILFRNLGDGTFEDVTSTAGLDAVVPSNGVLWVDIDGDQDLDLLVTTIAHSRFYLYVNDGSGVFSEEAVARGVDCTTPHVHGGTSVAAGDYNGDRLVDLYVTEWMPGFFTMPAQPRAWLLRNRPEQPGTFDEVAAAAGVTLDGVHPDGVFGFAPAFVDLDGDRLLDLAVVSDLASSRLFWNNGDGNFTDGTEDAGVGTDENGMGSAFGDYDGDGDLDWFVTSISCPDFPTPPYPAECSGNRLYRNEGGRVFSDQTDTAGVREGFWGWGATFLDADNDGDLDLMMTNGAVFPEVATEDAYHDDPMRYWENLGDGTFTETSATVGLLDDRSGKGALTFDYDRDGDQDLFLVNNGDTPVLYRNDGGNLNDWLRVDVKLNSWSDGVALGATVTLVDTALQFREIGVGSHFLGQSEALAHFGLGPGPGSPIATVRVVWPDGKSRIYSHVPRNTTLVARPPSRKGRCGMDGVAAALAAGWLIGSRRPKKARHVVSA